MKKTKEKQLLGTIYTTGSLQVAEIISHAGFDWVMIDMEHSVLSVEQVQNALPVFGEKILKIVRVPGNDELWIKRVMDTGCDGIMVPMVKTAQDAERLVRSAKYPPEGNRSVGLTRAHGYGQSFAGYVSSANSRIIIMAQIEHKDAVSNIDSILGVKGIDVIFIGPYDLSASMGLAGKVTHPEVVKAIELVKQRCKAASIPWGIFGAGPDGLKKNIEEGCHYILCGVDAALYATACKDLSDKLQGMIL
jgi:2-keto-3-deoxy-L-rhamnonate aldolase RhmA